MDNTIIFSRSDIDKMIKNMPFFNIVIDSLVFFDSCVKYCKLEGEPFKTKVEMYHKVWKNTIDDLYATNIPQEKNKYEIGIELTPYTVCIAENNIIDFNKMFSLSAYDKQFCKETYNQLITENIFTSENDVKINFIACILIMPPLLAIDGFYEKAYQKFCGQAKSIINTVQNFPTLMPPYKRNLGLGLATNFLNQKTYEKYGEMDGLIDNPLCLDIRASLLYIKNECKEEMKTNQNSICPHCGQSHNVILYQKDLFYINLTLLYRDISAKLVLNMMQDYRDMFSAYYLDAIMFDSERLNYVENPKCYIIVEGDTEEKAIPYMALKYHKPLARKGIKVWNAHTKEKVLMEFENFKNNNPDAYICVLLDGDAKKQIGRIDEMIRGKKNKYLLYFIEDGTFEDIIEKDIAVQALNSIYGEGTFCENDFKEKIPFVNQVRKKNHNNGISTAELPKIEFIKKVMELTNENNVPKMIQQIVDDCYNLVSQGK